VRSLPGGAVILYLRVYVPGPQVASERRPRVKLVEVELTERVSRGKKVGLGSSLKVNWFDVSQGVRKTLSDPELAHSGLAACTAPGLARIRPVAASTDRAVAWDNPLAAGVANDCKDPIEVL
jgi:hypothetical protein